MKQRITHDHLNKAAAGWLRNKCNCGVVLTEPGTYYCSETPDNIGYRGSGITVVVESKTSRSDFFADRKKFFRREPNHGLGMYRYFICPMYMIKVEELPSGWGVLYFNGRSVKEIHGSDHKFHYLKKDDDIYAFKDRNLKGEWSIMWTGLTKAQKRIRELDRQLVGPV